MASLTLRRSSTSVMRRNAYHYWYHTGEASAIWQLEGHENLPEFVGDIAAEAQYRPER